MLKYFEYIKENFDLESERMDFMENFIRKKQRRDYHYIERGKN
jgi:hypothetical protein